MVATINSLQPKLNWYAVYTRFKAEKKVEERLSLHGFDSFLPLQTIIRQWSDRKKKVQVPLINSYVFVRSEKKDLAKIYQVSGVVRILKYLGNYAIVKDTEIENLRILSNNGLPIQTSNKAINLSKGEKVNVLSGPFMGLQATYLMNGGKHKVIVEIETLGTYIELTMPLHGIQDT
jgi:transcription antitermination factor NusG